MENPFAYIADPLGIHWGWIAFGTWLALSLIVRKFIGWIMVGFIVLGFITSIGGYIIEPSVVSLGERLGSWFRFFVMLLVAAYLPHLLLVLLGLAGDGVRAGDYGGDGH
mgnify:CR=1 FL=1|tara:strand:+ start:9728 stop:10054 length:327 start_codon:yes stop_codon:yes gene_type:complete